MSHLIYEGSVYHKRFTPKEHAFSYPFFLLDIDVEKLSTLKSSFFTFKAKDHFGRSEDFRENVDALLEQFSIPKESVASMRFLTLPRMFNFVFNPISILVLFNEENKPTEMLVEVHNYNGGRIVYPVKLTSSNEKTYSGSVFKDMYVSPFLKRDGLYKFVLEYTREELKLSITLFEDNEKKLIARLDTQAHEFSSKSIRTLFFRHLFLTYRVVTRTLYQSFKLYIKGLRFTSPIPQDQLRRF
ncbi:MAG: DUF1365 domain-containing protein [Campylobacterales bacterium]|nr:DUF1365 domain-containing protein [Campylobacterales bacterium]